MQISFNITPRKWQLEALDIWQKTNRGIINVVTGGGKTFFAELCIKRFFDINPNGRVIIVVPTLTLLDQWYVSIIDDLNLKPTDIGCFSGQEKPEKPSTINIIVINTARKIASEISSGATSFLIVDECHRAGSPVNANALNGEYTATLGLSATPQREYDDGFYSYMQPILGNIIYEYDYTQAYHDKVICPFDLINVHIDLLPHERKEYDKISKKIAIEVNKVKNNIPHSEEKIKFLLNRRAAISSTALLRLPVSVKLLENHKGSRAIIFHERVSAAEELFDLLTKRKHSVTIYHSGIGPAIRRDNLRLYRKGIFDVLLCCRALDEGMNVPETSIAIIASSTASVRQRIQRLGRVLRPAPGKNIAIIYTLYATDVEERRLIDEAKKFNGISSIVWNKSTKGING